MARSSASAKPGGGERPLRSHRVRDEHPLLSASAEEKQTAVMRRDTPPLAVLAMARSRQSDAQLLDLIAENRRWIGYYDIAQALCFNPKTSLRHTLQLIQKLYPLHLVQLLAQTRLQPPLRTAAAHLLQTRLSSLSAGERLGLARNARGPACGVLLENESEPRVLGALLDNPALREMDVVRFAHTPDRPSAALGLLGKHRRWSVAYKVRSALVQNPRTPADIALGLVEGLHVQELREAVEDTRLSPVVRLVLGRYLQEKQRKGPFERAPAEPAGAPEHYLRSPAADAPTAGTPPDPNPESEE